MPSHSKNPAQWGKAGRRSAALRLPFRILVPAAAILLCFAAGCGGLLGQTGTPIPTATGAGPTGAPPTATRSATNVTPVANENVVIEEPRAQADAASPITVKGKARLFEAEGQVAVKDAQGKVVGEGRFTASAGAPMWGDFSVQVSYRLTGAKQRGSVEVFNRSAKDGSITNLLSVPVMLLPN